MLNDLDRVGRAFLFSMNDFLVSLVSITVIIILVIIWFVIKNAIKKCCKESNGDVLTPQALGLNSSTPRSPQMRRLESSTEVLTSLPTLDQGKIIIDCVSEM